MRLKNLVVKIKPKKQVNALDSEVAQVPIAIVGGKWLSSSVVAPKNLNRQPENDVSGLSNEQSP